MNWYAGKWLKTGAADGLLGSQTQKAEYRWVEAEQRRHEFRKSLWEQSQGIIYAELQVTLGRAVLTYSQRTD